VVTGKFRLKHPLILTKLNGVPTESDAVRLFPWSGSQWKDHYHGSEEESHEESRSQEAGEEEKEIRRPAPNLQTRFAEE
jgi:hypothetical protein